MHPVQESKQGERSFTDSQQASAVTDASLQGRPVVPVDLSQTQPVIPNRVISCLDAKVDSEVKISSELFNRLSVNEKRSEIQPILIQSVDVVAPPKKRQWKLAVEVVESYLKLDLDRPFANLWNSSRILQINERLDLISAAKKADDDNLYKSIFTNELECLVNGECWTTHDNFIVISFSLLGLSDLINKYYKKDVIEFSHYYSEPFRLCELRAPGGERFLLRQILNNNEEIIGLYFNKMQKSNIKHYFFSDIVAYSWLRNLNQIKSTFSDLPTQLPDPVRDLVLSDQIEGREQFIRNCLYKEDDAIRAFKLAVVGERLQLLKYMLNLNHIKKKNILVFLQIFSPVIINHHLYKPLKIIYDFIYENYTDFLEPFHKSFDPQFNIEAICRIRSDIYSMLKIYTELKINCRTNEFDQFIQLLKDFNHVFSSLLKRKRLGDHKVN